MKNTDAANFGAFAPGPFDRAILALTSRLPNNWLGLRLAIGLRRTVTMRLRFPDGALDIKRWGMQLRLHPHDNGCEKNLLFTPQMYEPIELRELASDIARAQAAAEPFVFVDIGANVGLFSLFVAARAGRNCRILAIEPEPGNLQRLRFNIQANAGVPIKVIPVALSDDASGVALKLDRNDRGGSRTRKITEAARANNATLVASQTLLSLLSAEGVDAVSALKIDVEGFEDVILHPFFRDAPARLWPRLIIIEDSRANWKVDVIPMLIAKGYAVAARSRQNLILRR